MAAKNGARNLGVLVVIAALAPCWCGATRAQTTIATAVATPPATAAEAQAQAQAYLDATVTPLLQANAPPDQVEPALQKCLALDPTFVPALYRLGVMAERQEAWDKALDYYLKALAVTSDPAKKAIAAKAAARMKTFIKIDSTPGGKEERQYDMLLVEAKVELGQGRFPDALAHGRQAQASSPGRWEAFLVIAAAQKGMKLYADEADSLQQALDVAPAGKTAAIQKLLNGAKAAVQQAATRAKFDGLLAQAAQDGAGNPAQAGNEARQAYELYPDKTSVALRAAGYFILAQKYHTAIDVLDEARKSARGDSKAKIRTLRAKVAKLDSLLRAQKASDLAFGLAYDNIPPRPLQFLRKQIRQTPLARNINIIDNDHWIVLSDKSSCTWAGIPQALADVLNGDPGKNYIRSVSMDNNGRWAVIWGFNGFNTNGLDNGALNALHACVSANQPIDSFTLGLNGEWVVIDQGNAYTYNNMPGDFVGDMKDFNTKGSSITEVSYVGDNFGIVGPQTLWYKGPQSMLDEINTLRAANRPITCIAVAPNNGWVVVTDRQANAVQVGAVAEATTDTSASSGVDVVPGGHAGGATKGSLDAFLERFRQDNVSGDAEQYAADFAEQVDYCYKTDGPATRDDIAEDRAKLIRGWPVRTMTRTLLNSSLYDQTGRADMKYEWNYSGARGSRSGTCEVRLGLTWVGNQWVISAYHETVQRN